MLVAYFRGVDAIDSRELVRGLADLVRQRLPEPAGEMVVSEPEHTGRGGGFLARPPTALLCHAAHK